MTVRTLAIYLSALAIAFDCPGDEILPTDVSLAVSDISEGAGDGPDGVGNSDDDTWGFWFALAHDPKSFRRLTRHSSAVPKAGIPGKIRGPVGSMLPNPGKTEGWILHTDWDGRFEGVWTDSETGEILVHPYVEKGAHMAVAVTYTIPADGTYAVSLGITDVQVAPDFPKHDGVIWILELIDPARAKTAEVSRGEPVGDGHGRPDSDTYVSPPQILSKGVVVRLVIHPNKWWGQDLTRIDRFVVRRLK